MEAQPTTDELVGLLLSINDIDRLRENIHLRSSLEQLSDAQLVASLDAANSSQETNPAVNDPLTVLHPSSHSLGYFYFITAKCKLATRHSAMDLYHLLAQFIQVADWNQVKLAGNQMSRLVTALDHLAQIQNNDILPLTLLYTVITRLDTDNNASVLTVFHSALAKRCILTKMYKYPLTILNKAIDKVDPKVYGTTIEHYLEYHYYGAILYIGNKEYEKAMDFLTLVMTAPVQKAISAIQLEAYKRYILVSLITFGKLLPLPKYVSSAIEKTCKKQSGAYFILVEAFGSQDIVKLSSVIQKHQITFDSDGLLGLTRQLIQACYRKRITTLTSVYYKVKLDDLALQISPASATSPLTKDQIEHLLVDMIGKNHINATLSIVLIDGIPVKMVQFDQESSPIPILSNHSLEQAINHVALINDQLSIMDKIEGLNKDFQSKYMSLCANGGQLGPVSNMDEDMDVPLDDDTKGFV